MCMCLHGLQDAVYLNKYLLFSLFACIKLYALWSNEGNAGEKKMEDLVDVIMVSILNTSAT